MDHVRQIEHCSRYFFSDSDLRYNASPVLGCGGAGRPGSKILVVDCWDWSGLPPQSGLAGWAVQPGPG